MDEITSFLPGATDGTEKFSVLRSRVLAYKQFMWSLFRDSGDKKLFSVRVCVVSITLRAWTVMYSAAYLYCFTPTEYPRASPQRTHTVSGARHIELVVPSRGGCDPRKPYAPGYAGMYLTAVA